MRHSESLFETSCIDAASLNATCIDPSFFGMLIPEEDISSMYFALTMGVVPLQSTRCRMLHRR